MVIKYIAFEVKTHQSDYLGVLTFISNCLCLYYKFNTYMGRHVIPNITIRCYLNPGWTMMNVKGIIVGRSVGK